MKKPLIILTSALMAFTAVAATGCGEAKFDKYGYENVQPIASEVYDFSEADGMKTDGVKDDKYGSEYCYRLYDGSDDSIYVDSYIYFGEEGLHCFVSAHDKVLSYHHLRAVYQNTSVELFFNSATKADGTDKLSIDRRTLQYRLDCGGKYSKLVGVGGKSTYVTSYFDSAHAVKVNGTLNGTNEEGFDAEVFIPWYEFGFIKDEKGKYNVGDVTYRVAYSAKTDATVNTEEFKSSRSYTTKSLSFQATPYTWVPIGKRADGTGECLTSADGDVFGMLQVGADKYYPTYKFDLSHDNATDRKITLDSFSPTSYAFVKNGYDTDYYFECNVSKINAGTVSSPYVGIVNIFPSNRTLLYIRTDKTSGKKYVGVAQRDMKNSAWVLTAGADYAPYEKETAVEGDVIKLAAYRHGDAIAYFVNDEILCVTAATKEEAPGFSDIPEVSLRGTTASTGSTGRKYYSKCMAGIYSFGPKAEFSDYTYLKGTDAQTKFNELAGITADSEI